MSNGSTLPSLLGGNLGFYFPGQLGCAAGANTGQCYNPLSGFDAAAAGGDANALYAALVDKPNIPNEFFKANVWRSLDTKLKNPLRNYFLKKTLIKVN